jgi:peptidoglycan/xylan/chitin deacetylase (PgdA/CDA1 family)
MRIFRRCSLIGAVLLLLGLYIFPFTSGHAVTVKKKIIALTFDDGPDPRMTPTVLDILKAKRVKATFFLQGQHVELYPDLVRRTVNEGHRLAGHSYSHPHQLYNLPPVEQIGEIDYANQLIWQAAKQRVTLFRYPHGNETAVANDYLKFRGLTSVHWHEASQAGDWLCPGSDFIVEQVATHVVPGAVVLLHDGNETADCGENAHYLPVLIDRLRHDGYTFGHIEPSSKYSEVNKSYVRVVA